MDRTTYIRLSILILLLCVLLALFSPHIFPKEEHLLRVTFLDVGQGDSIFIESPTGFQVLIDGGPNGSVLRQLSREMGFFDRTIDVILATHPDSDHIGGLIDILKRYEVGMIILTENGGTSGTADAFRASVEQEGAVISYARRGMTYDLGAGVSLSILFPDRNPVLLASNTASIITRLAYGEHEFLLSGDAPQAIEEYLVSLGGDLASEVLKVGHHGSNTSTSDIFLSAVQPEYAIISAGADNRYGHPHARVIEALVGAGAHIENTAEGGSIHFVSDGATLSLIR